MPDPVPLRPPLDLVRPVAAREIPGEGALKGGVQYSVKLDGFRCAAFRLEDRVVLQSRSGRDLGPRFPTVREAVADLPVGAVLDGELCAVQDGRFVFEQLHRSPVRRTAQVVYVAFDLLAVPGRSLLAEPLSERWRLLTDVVSAAPPEVQQVMATTDRAEAVRWYDTLTVVGIEGLVARGFGSRYGPRTRWVKVRHGENLDGEVIGAAGPTALRVRLDDGREVTTEQLTIAQVQQVADAFESVRGPLRVELRVGTGRHGAVRFVRVRGD
jgi:ATP-dependent DNA ligase